MNSPRLWKNHFGYLPAVWTGWILLACTEIINTYQRSVLQYLATTLSTKFSKFSASSLTQYVQELKPDHPYHFRVLQRPFPPGSEEALWAKVQATSTKPWRGQGLTTIIDCAGLDFSLDKPLSGPERNLGKILSYACPYMRGNQTCGQYHQDYQHLSFKELGKWCSTNFLEYTRVQLPRVFTFPQTFTFMFPFFIPGIPL